MPKKILGFPEETPCVNQRWRKHCQICAKPFSEGMVNEESRGISGKVVLPKSPSVETVAGEDPRSFTGKKRASIGQTQRRSQCGRVFPEGSEV